MLRTVGAGLICGAGLLLRTSLLAAHRAETDTVRDLRDALLALEREVALTLTPLPALFLRGGFGKTADAFFTQVAQEIHAGKTLAESWAECSGALMLPQEVKLRVVRLGAHLGGDEESVRRALLASAQELSGVLERREREQSSRERITTALCLSGSLLLLLLLMQ